MRDFTSEIEIVAPAPDESESSRGRRPLHERWDRLLDRILDPNKTLIRLKDAGMGSWLDRTLGGGLQPGNSVGFGAAGAGGGKTAFMHQIADGLAKMSARNLLNAAGSNGRPTVIPVVYVAEMQESDLITRTLAREAERPGHLIRAPNSEDGVLPSGVDHLTQGQEALRAARAAAEQFRQATAFLEIVDRTVEIGFGGSSLDRLQRICDGLRERARDLGAEVPAVFLMIDPLHRLIDPAVSETEGLGEVLGQILRITHKEGLVTFFASDTTKNAVSVRGEGASNGMTKEQKAELAFRGSYQLLHYPDYAYLVQTLQPSDAPEARDGMDPDMRDKFFSRGSARHTERTPWVESGDYDVWLERRADRTLHRTWGTRYAELVSPKLRWQAAGQSPAFWYDGALFRYEPMTQHMSSASDSPSARRPETSGRGLSALYSGTRE